NSNICFYFIIFCHVFWYCFYFKYAVASNVVDGNIIPVYYLDCSCRQYVRRIFHPTQNSCYGYVPNDDISYSDGFAYTNIRTSGGDCIWLDYQTTSEKRLSNVLILKIGCTRGIDYRIKCEITILATCIKKSLRRYTNQNNHIWRKGRTYTYLIHCFCFLLYKRETLF